MEGDAVEGRLGRKWVQLKFALLTLLVLLMCVASSPSHSAPPIPACTSGTSSVAYGEEPVTIWYPPGLRAPLTTGLKGLSVYYPGDPRPCVSPSHTS